MKHGDQEHESTPSPEQVTPPLRRRPRRRKQVYTAPRRRRWGAVAGLLVVLGGAVFAYHLATTARYAVKLEGRTLAVLATKEEAVEAVQQLKSRYGDYAPESVSFAEGAPTIDTVYGVAHLSKPPDAVDTLDIHLTALIDGYAIYVNRKPLVLLGSKEDAAKAIALMQARVAKGQSGIPAIKERVALQPYQQAEDDEEKLPFLTPEKAADMLSHPPREAYHTVERGDSFYRIAQTHGTTIDMLKSLNPKLNPGALKVGDQVKLPDEPSAVTIVMRSID